jgi:hypothetical protein
MEDGHVSKVMSHLSQLYNHCPQNLSLSPNLLLNYSFFGGWCILGETALENKLQSNKTC